MFPGSDFADDDGGMLYEHAPSAHPELKKRRSTRIVQAVPLLVTGVDALGRPFQERTSTLIINCHGCRYQSKHYVLKNMWVTLEIPNPEPGRPPRTVRGRVVWIQRPRTVRQLFQVAVQLEVPGNIWGIGFPPEDWFPFAELAAVKAAEMPEGADAEPPPVEEEAYEERAGEGVHVLPSATATDVSMQLARQMARLLAEAKQQVQKIARESAVEAVAAETKPLLSELQARFDAAVRALDGALAQTLNQGVAAATARLQESQAAAAGALREEIPRALAPQMEEMLRQMTAQLAQAGARQSEEQEQRLQATLAAAREALGQLDRETGAHTEKLHARLARFEQELENRVKKAAQRWEQATGEKRVDADAQRESLMRTAAEVRHQIEAAVSAAEKNLRSQIASDLGSAEARWKQAMETSLAAATRDAENAVGGLRTALTEETQRAQGTLSQAEQLAGRIEHLAAGLNEIGRAALEQTQARFNELLAGQATEFERRGEAMLNAMTGRLEPILDSAGQQAVARLGAEMESRVAPHLNRAAEVVESLAGMQTRAEELARTERERLQEQSEKMFGEAVVRIREQFSALEAQAQEASQSAAARWLAEFEAKTGDIQHATVDSLYKSAEWYEKKVQMQLQASLEKGVEQAGAALREKAGEVSGAFAAELDHYSRSFVEHTQEQMEETVKDAFERSRSLFSEAAETTSAAFIDEIQRSARRELDGYEQELGKSLAETRAQSEAVAERLRAQMTAEGQQYYARFQEGMSGAIQSGVGEAGRRLEASLGPLLDTWKSSTQAHQAHLEELYTHLGDEAVDQYKKRLENITNSWMVASVTTLDRQSQDLLASVARSAEVKLRETFVEVFSGIGDTLRSRLAEIAASFAPAPPAGEKK